MNLREIVTNRQISSKLKKFGAPQSEAWFSWYQLDGPVQSFTGEWLSGYCSPSDPIGQDEKRAFTYTEVLFEIQKFFASSSYNVNTTIKIGSVEMSIFYDGKEIKKEAENIQDAAGLILIELLEKNYDIRR